MDAPDSLTLLRQYCRDGKGKIEGDDIVIGQWAIGRNEQTNFFNKREKSYYTNEMIFHFINHREKTFTQYIKVTPTELLVARIDTKNMKNFLENNTPTASIKESGPVSIARFVGGAATIPPAQAAHVEPSGKRDAADLADEEWVAKKAHTTASAMDATSKDATAQDSAVTANLDASKDATLSSAKRAEIKAKRQRRKRQIAVSSVTRAIHKNELVFMTRTTALRAQGKDFTGVLDLLRKKDEEERERKRRERKEKQTQQKYKRYEQTGETVDQGPFDVNLAGSSFHPGSTNKKSSESNASSSTSKNEKKTKKHVSKTPIIIVPAGMSQLISLSNVRSFLEKGIYISTVEAAKTKKREDSVLIQRPTKHGLVKYRVVDRPQLLSSEDWKRVIAVFVSGKKWQFKQWPEIQAGKSVVDIFSKRRAFHVMFDDAQLSETIGQWNCKVLQLSRSNRHMDQTASHEFWEALDQWAIPRFPDLQF